MANVTHINAPNRFVEARGVRYAYRRFGCDAAIPILLLQHFRGGLDHWDPVVTDGLAEERPVILFDSAGIGLSTGEAVDTVAGMAEHASTFLAALGLQQVDLLGFSLGGFVAQQLTLDHPKLIRRLVLAGTGPQGGEGMDTYHPRVAEVATRLEPTREDFLYLFFEPTPTSQAAGRAFWERRHARKEYVDVPSSLQAMQRQGAAIADWGMPKGERYGRLKDIQNPVLVVNGARDILVPTVNSYILQQRLPNAQLILYPDSGHGALFQYAQTFVEHVATFLRNTASWQPSEYPNEEEALA